MRLLAWLPAFLVAANAWGHAVSMSSGDLAIEGARAHYTLRMPLYEIAHTAHPEDALLAHIRFAGARLTAHSCRTETAQDSFICEFRRKRISFHQQIIKLPKKTLPMASLSHQARQVESRRSA